MRRANGWMGNMRSGISAAALAAVLSFLPGGPLHAAEEGRSEELAQAKIPETAEEHQAMAQSYRIKAANYRREAEAHQKMLDEYKFKVVAPGKGPSHKEAQRHCERYMRDARRLAEEAGNLADYHASQAKALQGR